VSKGFLWATKMRFLILRLNLVVIHKLLIRRCSRKMLIEIVFMNFLCISFLFRSFNFLAKGASFSFHKSTLQCNWVTSPLISQITEDFFDLTLIGHLFELCEFLLSNFLLL
jgi:hypothetical protein